MDFVDWWFWSARVVVSDLSATLFCGCVQIFSRFLFVFLYFHSSSLMCDAFCSLDNGELLFQVATISSF